MPDMILAVEPNTQQFQLYLTGELILTLCQWELIQCGYWAVYSEHTCMFDNLFSVFIDSNKKVVYCLNWSKEDMSAAAVTRSTSDQTNG